MDPRSVVAVPHGFPRGNARCHRGSQRQVGRKVHLTEQRQFHYYNLLVHIFVVILLISNLVGQKVAAIGWFPVSGAQVFFPITYIFGDVFTVVYGYAASRRAIWIGFMASALLAILGLFAVWLPPAPEWRNQQAFQIVFGFV